MRTINQYFKENKSKVKIKVRWTPEIDQNINVYHNINAENELIRILSEEISLEIDREILTQLRLNYGVLTV